MRRALLVMLCIASLVGSGCGGERARTAPGKSAKPWERVPWEGMTPEERDRTAAADLMRSEKFKTPSCRWLKHGAWIAAWPSEAHLYKAAYEEGIIEMTEAGTENRIGTPEPAWRITITEEGKEQIAECKVSRPGNDWGVPVSRRHFLSAKYAGEAGRYSGLTFYDVEYEWVPTAVGARVKGLLTGPMAIQEGKYRARMTLRKTSNGWFLDQTNDLLAERID